MFRFFGLVSAALCVAISLAKASPKAVDYEAGITQLVVRSDGEDLSTLVWYPTNDVLASWTMGPFKVNATRQAQAAAKERFPVLLLSHGHQSDPLAHRDLAATLARHGFIVVVPTHTGDAFGTPMQSLATVMRSRPKQASAALSAVLRSETFARHVDADRIGAIGYSAGGYTALILAGAQPDFKRAAAYCSGEGARDVGSCLQKGAAWSSPGMADLQSWQPAADARIKALVLLEPHAIMFDIAGLQEVERPLLLVGVQDDSLMPAALNTDHVGQALDVTPVKMPGAHFVFVDPCPLALIEKAAVICKDAPDVDRESVHRELTSQIVEFFQGHL